MKRQDDWGSEKCDDVCVLPCLPINIEEIQGFFIWSYVQVLNAVANGPNATYQYYICLQRNVEVHNKQIFLTRMKASTPLSPHLSAIDSFVVF
jgi:hypothetical protein